MGVGQQNFVPGIETSKNQLNHGRMKVRPQNRMVDSAMV
jgi:hypothetical protein